MQGSRGFLALFLSSSLVLAGVQAGCATEAFAPAGADAPAESEIQPPVQPGSRASAQAAQAGQPTADELDQLVAPIALYPDALVAQVLAAATFPEQIVEADRWIQENPDLKADALAKAIDPQAWDPSVKALAQFPSVLAMMDKNLSWTSSLGDAYVNAQQNVLDAVQVMRQRAQQAGNLKSSQQETVTDDAGTIAIEPAEPDVVYVPEYDPWVVYGAPIAFYPGWFGVPGLYIDGPGIAFGLGIGVGVFAGFGWGWHHWGADWHRHDLMFDHHTYISHSRTFANRHDFGRADARAHGGGFHGDGLSHGGQFHQAGASARGAPGGGFSHPAGGAMSGLHSSAFSGFDHGGVATTFSSRGRASVGGGFHGGGGGGFHGGGGGFHGGGGGGHR